jgi:hypothetical protein
MWYVPIDLHTALEIKTDELFKPSFINLKKLMYYPVFKEYLLYKKTSCIKNRVILCYILQNYV